MLHFLKPLLLLSLLIPTYSIAQGVRNTLSGPSATVQTDGTDSVGAVNIATQNAGRINFFINNTIRGYFDGTTGALTGVTFGTLSLANNVWFKARNAANSADINVFRVNATDDLEIASDSGDTIIISPEGTADLTITAAQTAIGSANYQIVPGSSSYTIRNNADDTNNFLFNESGVFALGGGDPRVNSSARLILGVDGDSNRFFTFDASSDTDLTLTFGDSGGTALQVLSLTPSTTNTDDDATIQLGFASGLRGAGITLPGEESSGGADITYNAGTGDAHIFKIQEVEDLRIEAAQMTLGSSNYQIVSGSSSIAFRDSTDATNNFLFNNSGNMSIVGTFTSSAASDLGWSVVDQTDNQACNTGCTSACVLGIENATGTAVTNLVSCAATSSDLCVCAGAS